MLSKSLSVGPQPRVVLVSVDSVLTMELHRVLSQLGIPMLSAAYAEAVIAAVHGELHGASGAVVILLDGRLPAVAQGQLLAALHEADVHRRCALALIADEVSDEWIARLREGAIDDIVPRVADTGSWSTHLSTMQRGHALHCELEQLRETAHFGLDLDLVTGIFNRETMLSILFRETDRVQRQRGALCLVLLDIDDFAHWTSTFGSGAGDQLLREVADRTGRMMRNYDVLGRVDSERFMMVLPGCSLVNAEMLAERMRLEVFGAQFVVTDTDGERVQIRLTASFGITSSRGRSPVVVMHEAEQTVERGKAAGPNSIRCASDLPATPETGEGLRQLFRGNEILMR